MKEKMLFYRRDFLLSLPFIVSFKTKKLIEVIVGEKNNVVFTYEEENELKNVFKNVNKNFPFADFYEINFNYKEKYLLKKFENIVPLIFGVTVWTVQSWNYSNKTWNEVGEIFCLNF